MTSKYLPRTGDSQVAHENVVELVHCCKKERLVTNVYTMLWACKLCSHCIRQKLGARFAGSRHRDFAFPDCCELSTIPRDIVCKVIPELRDRFEQKTDGRNQFSRPYVVKGKSLLALTIKEDQTGSTESHFQDPGALAQWGWHLRQRDTHWQSLHLSEAMRGLKNLEPLAVVPRVEWYHKQTAKTVIDGLMYPGTGAYFEGAFSTDHGVMVVSDIVSPKYSRLARVEDDVRLPKLQHWSDVVFLGWLFHAGRQAARKLQYVFHVAAVNENSEQVIRWVLGRNSAGMARWPGISFRATSDEGRALMATPNGAGVAYLLVQHKCVLGKRTISDVTVFLGDDGSACLLFWIIDVR